jgi:hypothetical protein
MEERDSHNSYEPSNIATIHVGKIASSQKSPPLIPHQHHFPVTALTRHHRPSGGQTPRRRIYSMGGVVFLSACASVGDKRVCCDNDVYYHILRSTVESIDDGINDVFGFPFQYEREQTGFIV